jgi:hypothetical protein
VAVTCGQDLHVVLDSRLQLLVRPKELQQVAVVHSEHHAGELRGIVGL